MFRALILLCLVAAPALGSWEGSLKVRFDLTLFGIGTTAFIELPQTIEKAIEEGWVLKNRPEGLSEYSSLVLYCPSTDNTVGVLFDDTGYIAGLQTALDVTQFTDGIYDWETQGFTSWTTELNGETKNYWTTQQYYISADNLATDPAIRIAARNPERMLQDEFIWVSGFHGKLYPISTNVSDIVSGKSEFTEQACIPWMGNHYYYNMSAVTECSADTLMPWFPLIYSNQLIGVGLVMYGKHTINEGSKDWFEKPTSGAVKAIVPRGPECLYNLADTPGMVTMHSYFIKHPYKLTCLFQ